MPYALREALAAFRRAPLLTALSVVGISLSLFVVGLFALAAFNIRRAIEGIEERVEVVAYLRDGSTEEEVRLARLEVVGLPGVARIDFVSKDDALVTAVQELEEFREVFTNLEVNPLPASLEVQLRPGYRTPEAIERVAQRLSAYAFVEEVSYGRDWLGKIVSLRRIAGGATAIIGGPSRPSRRSSSPRPSGSPSSPGARRSRSCASSARPTASSSGPSSWRGWWPGSSAVRSPSR